jgi:hypothetical protein
MTVFRQPSLLFDGDAHASASKRGEGSRKNGLFGPKWERRKLLPPIKLLIPKS